MPAVEELLSLLYRPEHFYVFHVDRRQPEVHRQLSEAIRRRFGHAHNVGVVPLEVERKSLVTLNVLRLELRS